MPAADAQIEQVPQGADDQVASLSSGRRASRGARRGVGYVARQLAQTAGHAWTRARGRMAERTRRRLSLALRIAFSLLLLALVFSKAKVHKFVGVLAHMDVALALLGLGVGLLTIVLSALMWEILLRRERIMLGLPTVTGIYLLGHTFNLLLPSSVGGDVAKAAYAGRFSGRGVGAASATLMSRVLGLVTLFLTAIPSAVVATLLVPGLGWTLTLILLAAGIAYSVCLCGLFYGPALIRRVAGARLGHSKVGRKLLEVAEAVAEYRQYRATLLQALLVSLVFYLASNLNFYIYGRALHLQAPFWFYWFAIPLTSLATLLPISLNGFGVRGASFVLVFAAMREPAAKALSLSSTMELQMLLFAFAGAGVIVGFNRRLRAGAPRAQPALAALAANVTADHGGVGAPTYQQSPGGGGDPASPQHNGQAGGAAMAMAATAPQPAQAQAPTHASESPEPLSERPPRGAAGRARRNLLLPGLAVLLLVAIVGVLGAQRLLKTTPDVQLYTVSMQHLTSYVGGGGLTYPAQQLGIAYPVSAQVLTVSVQVGQKVSAGQPLLTLDSATLSVQLDQALAQWQIAQSFVNRLIQTGGTATEIAGAQQQALLAKSQYDRLNALLNSPSFNRGAIIAPFSGTVTDIGVNPGTIFRANSTLLTLSDVSAIIVRAQFPVTQASQVQIGAQVEIDPAASPGQRFSGTVATINAQLRDKGSSSFEAWIKVPNPQGALFLGESVYARVATTQTLPTVPELAVINPQSDAIVFVYANGRAHIRHVELGARDIDRFGIVSGLQPGDQVILTGQYQLEDNEPVHVSKIAS